MIKKIVNKLKGFNKVVIFLTLSDIFTWGSYTLVSLLTGIYLSSKLGGDIAKYIGIGTAIYFLTRAIFQIPLGLITDKYKDDKDEILILFIGTLLMGIPFLFYPDITQPYQFYILQFIFGLGVALNVTNWRKLFALNIDGGKEGIQYGIYEMILSISIAVISIVGGIIANMGSIYFDLVMSFAAVFMMLGNIWIILIYKYEDRKSKI